MIGRRRAGERESLYAAVAGFVLGADEPPPPEVLRRARLGAYAYTALPGDHPYRPELRKDYLAAAVRHQRIKQELVPLIAAWRRAGIEVLFFKGFHLAEFFYPHPGSRFHGDVDVLMREEDLEPAAQIAAELGWGGGPAPDNPIWRPHHGAYTLWFPGGDTQVDVQRYVVHSLMPWARKARRLTGAVWASSVEVEWEGTTVRVPDPVDAALICLILHRSWETAPWQLKVFDPIDLRILAERARVTREALRARAKEVGGERTLAAFLERCDPGSGRWATERPGHGTRLRLGVRCWLEKTPEKAEKLAIRSLRLPFLALAALRALPALVRVLYRVRREPNLWRLMASLTRPPARRRGSLAWRRYTVSALRHLARIAPRGGAGLCLVRSVAVYVALRRQGWPVVFVSGVRREGEGVVGHAWVEYEGRPLPELGEGAEACRYVVNFRYPAEAGATAGEPGHPGARGARTGSL
jgi:hypothetical protein